MKRSVISGRKMLAVIAAAVLLFSAAGCGENAPANTDGATAGQSADDTSAAAEVSSQEDETSETQEEESASGLDLSHDVMKMIGADRERVNRFLTSIVQQEIENTATDLNDDEELVRFVFRYRETNDADSIVETGEGDDACRTLTLEQINETLFALFGKTLAPDRTDYSVRLEDSGVFHCSYADGVFTNEAPFPEEKFPFRIRFALMESLDEETCTVHFRLYKVNPYEWGIGEASRHLPLLPSLSLHEAENGRGDVKKWITRIGEGDAVLTGFGESIQLVEMTVTMLN